jgi:hypothetical protein
MSDAMNRLSDGAKAGVDAASDAAKDVAKRGARFRNAAREVASEGGRAIGDAYTAVADKAVDSYEYGRDKVYEWESSLEDLIKARPILTLLVSLGVAFAAGFLLRPTPKRRRR